MLSRNGIFSVTFLQAVIIAVVGSPILTALLVAAYCSKHHLPFFEVIDQLDRYYLYINVLLFIYLLLGIMFIMAPVVIRHVYEEKLIDTIVLGRLTPKMTLHRRFRRILSMIPIVFPGFVLVTLFHIIILYRFYVGGEGWPPFWFFMLLCVFHAVVLLLVTVGFFTENKKAGKRIRLL